MALISGGIDSPVAAWMMMKRGCRIIPLYVNLEDVLDESNRQGLSRVIEALRLVPARHSLRVWSTTLSLVGTRGTDPGRAGETTCILCKSRMYRVAESYARSVGAKGIVTGESLGQVASQTLDNLLVSNDAAGIPVYRPLIGFDKEQIVRIAREIGTVSLRQPSVHRDAVPCRRSPQPVPPLERSEALSNRWKLFPLEVAGLIRLEIVKNNIKIKVYRETKGILILYSLDICSNT